jgi:hypothetical protein
MSYVKALTEQDFFASATAVCVYAEVSGIGVRVEFTSPDAAGTVGLGSSEVCAKALAIATKALDAHREKLLPLFARLVSARSDSSARE